MMIVNHLLKQVGRMVIRILCFVLVLFVCFKKKTKNVYRPLYTRTIYPTFGLLPFFVSFLPLNFFCSYFLLHYFRYETNPQKTIKNRRVQAIYRKFSKIFITRNLSTVNIEQVWTEIELNSQKKVDPRLML